MFKSLFLVLLSFISYLPSSYAASIKEPNVAGAFYSADAKELFAQMDSFITQASINLSDKKIQAMIVPHAGYVYSGPIAAYGYKAISQNQYSTIVVLAPSHYFPFDGISVWPQGGFKTPLGIINVDDDFAKKLIEADSQFKFLPEVFEKEHSIEAELPFIQKVLGNVKVVPVLMGNPDPKVCQKLAVVLNALIGSREDVLVLASSDMSHYFPYDTANKMDAATLGAISEEDPQKFWDGCLVSHQMEMCGVLPVTTLLLYAKERGLQVQVLKHANSGDTAGDKSKVVGYSSVIFYKDKVNKALSFPNASIRNPDSGPPITSDGSTRQEGKTFGGDNTLNVQQKKALLKLAKDTLESFVTTGKTTDMNTNDPRLLQTQGAFVTLRKNGQLRGCIGNMIGDKPLWQTIHEMTMAAASSDPRFPPVTKEELKDIDLEISVLTPPKRIFNASAIVLGRDGVIVSDGSHQGVFLPQVAGETHWSKEEFLNELCSQKAGLPADCWKNPKINLWTFQADVF